MVPDTRTILVSETYAERFSERAGIPLSLWKPSLGLALALGSVTSWCQNWSSGEAERRADPNAFLRILFKNEKVGRIAETDFDFRCCDRRLYPCVMAREWCR